MSTIMILAGFALMLFLPCILTMISLREREDLLDGPSPADGDSGEDMNSDLHALAPAYGVPAAQGDNGTYSEAIDWNDPLAPGRGSRLNPTRIELAEVEVMRSRAIAIRAQADALEAVAQAALAKADAAAEEAVLAEIAAAQAALLFRRAA